MDYIPTQPLAELLHSALLHTASKTPTNNLHTVIKQLNNFHQFIRSVFNPIINLLTQHIKSSFPRSLISNSKESCFLPFPTRRNFLAIFVRVFIGIEPDENQWSVTNIFAEKHRPLVVARTDVATVFVFVYFYHQYV